MTAVAFAERLGLSAVFLIAGMAKLFDLPGAVGVFEGSGCRDELP